MHPRLGDRLRRLHGRQRRAAAIQRDLGGGLALQQWVVDAYLLTLGSLILVGGSLGDLFGAQADLRARRSSPSASPRSSAPPRRDGTTLIVARGLQGVAGALLTPAALATITATFSGEERGAAIGTWTAWTGIAFVIGPLVGGWLVTLALVALDLPDQRPDRDRHGSRSSSIAVPRRARAGRRAPGRRRRRRALRARARGPGVRADRGAAAWLRRPADPRHAASAASRSSPLFVALGAAHADPMLPLRLFRRRNFTFANIETLDRLRRAVDADVLPRPLPAAARRLLAVRSGLALVPITIVMFFLSPRVGRLSMRFGPRLFMGVGPLVVRRRRSCAIAARARLRLLDASCCRRCSSSRSGSR